MTNAETGVFLFFMWAISFVLTVAIFVFIVRRAKLEHRIYWILGCSVLSLLWLGIYKGIAASVISIAISSGYIATRLDARRIGKRIADSLGIEHNLFFTSLEQSLPLYLSMLAQLERSGMGVVEAKEITLPYVEAGLDVLENRFGRQPKIDAARVSIQSRVMSEESRI